MPCGGLIQSGKEEYRKFQSCGSFCTRLHLSKNATLKFLIALAKDKNSLRFPRDTRHLARGILFLNFEADVTMTLYAWTD